MSHHRSRKAAAIVALSVAIVVSAITPAVSGGRDLFVSQTASLNGTEVPRGTYRLSWKKNGGEDLVKVSLFQGNTLVATAEGRVVESEAENAVDSVVYHVGGDGKRAIVGVRFGGKSREIEITS
jgi:hypothetical protein